MQCYHTPFVGFILSKESKEDYFFKIVNELCLDNFLIESLSLEVFEEYLNNGDEYTDYSLDIEKDRNVLRSFLSWIEERQSLFDLFEGYHGNSITTPLALILKDSSRVEIEQSSSYTVSNKSIDLILKDSIKHQEYCKKTMSEELFLFFEKRGDFGIQFLHCST